MRGGLDRPLQKAKKSHSSLPTSAIATSPSADVKTSASGNELSETDNAVPKREKPNSSLDSTPSAPKRSQYGIWIGNLPFTATKDNVRDFLQKEGGIEAQDVIRLNLPTTPANGKEGRAGSVAQNKEAARGAAQV